MLFSGLGRLPLMQPDEGRNAEVAREMAVSRSWLVPTLEGLPYLDKPAAYFATVALSLRVFGVNEWAARLPSALCGSLILVLLYVFLERRYDTVTAGLAVIVVATSPMLFAFSRLVIMDVMLGACTVAAILAAYVAEDGAVPDRRWHAAGAAAAGCGMLVKGPVGALVPWAVLIAFFWADGRKAALRRVFAPLNVVIVLGLFLPWFAALVYAHPEFAHYGLVEETFNRFFTPTFNRGQPFWFFGPVFLVTFFPWTVLFVPMAIAGWSARKRLTRADRLFIAWTIVVIVFFSLSRTKQPGYILTGVVAAGVCVGRGLGYAWRNREGRAARLVAQGALALAGLALVLAAALGLAVSRGAADAGRLAAMSIRERSVWSMWPAFLIVLSAIAILGFSAGALRNAGLAVAAFAFFPFALVTVWYPALEGYALSRSAKPLALALSSLPAGAEVACIDSYPPGLSFYLGRKLTILAEDATLLRSNFVLYWMSHLPVRPQNIVHSAGREAWLGSRETAAFVLAPDASRAQLDAWLGSRYSVRETTHGWWGALVPRSGGALMLLYRSLRAGDSPLFRDKAVSGELCKKRGLSPFRSDEDVRDLRRRRPHAPGILGAVQASRRRVASAPEAPRPRRGSACRCRRRGDRRDAARHSRSALGNSQPVVDAASGIVVACNGEIDNHRELRAWLEARGHVIPQETDIAVIPALYLEHGEAFAEHLIGAFAVAVWDPRVAPRRAGPGSRRRKAAVLHGARRRGGLRLGAGGAGHRPRPSDRDRSRGDRRLPAARLLRGAVDAVSRRVSREARRGRDASRSGHVRTRRFWSLKFAAGSKFAAPTRTRSIGSSARRSPARATSPSPAGSSCRAGSTRRSSPRSRAAFVRSGRLRRTRSASTRRRTTKARPRRSRASTLGIPWATVTVGLADVRREIEKLVSVSGEPLADPAWMPASILSRRAVEDVRLVMVGEGADELFGGYPTYIGALLADRYSRWPQPVRRRSPPPFRALPVTDKKVTISYLLKRFVEGNEFAGSEPAPGVDLADRAAASGRSWAWRVKRRLRNGPGNGTSWTSSSRAISRRRWPRDC